MRGIPHLAPVDDEAEYFGFAHRALRRCRRLTELKREQARFLQLGQERG